MEMDADSQEREALHHEGQNKKEKFSVGSLWDLLWSPINWVKMLSSELHWSFVVSVIIVYGISQGLSMGLSRVSIQYYLKDEQKVQPSEAQVYLGIIQIPWLWGLFTDALPILGYRRKPYFVFAGVIGVVSMLVLSLDKKLDLTLSLLSLMVGSAGVTIADVTIDACVTENSISHPSLAGDMQSLCGLNSSIGALVGFSISGFFVHLLGPKGVFGLLSIPPALVNFVGMMLRESHFHNFSHRRVSEMFADSGKVMWTTLKCSRVWRRCLYMYLSLALSLSVREGMFYWYTDVKGGPSFSKEVVGSIYSVGALGSLLGVLLYQNILRNCPFRDVLFWAQLLYGLSGLLDLVFVLRINLKFGLPDYLFVVIDEAVTHMIGRLKWMPLLVLSLKLCPAGIEGTFFALLMSIDHVGILTSTWVGGLLLHILNITRTQFDNLWIAILIRSILRILPIALLFLIPRADPNSSILPSEMLRTKKGDDLESENLEMASLVNAT
ncbi:LOW QUALITY PROTEIN: probable folate-biopterin transporter 3 [Argentina anserina]|uniref:LOW QUALITY PROTEIN: probable folate-biopterin transporter 3 n=1 Tax=Argentina anserina TaxID=57926 RepID=UPI002176599F|nr:LOW QUALITY PROTEIN: probable folate-biopterin transporter 3 [Potentilla anserina]